MFHLQKKICTVSFTSRSFLHPRPLKVAANPTNRSIWIKRSKMSVNFMNMEESSETWNNHEEPVVSCNNGVDACI